MSIRRPQRDATIIIEFGILIFESSFLLGFVLKPGNQLGCSCDLPQLSHHRHPNGNAGATLTEYIRSLVCCGRLPTPLLRSLEAERRINHGGADLVVANPWIFGPNCTRPNTPPASGHQNPFCSRQWQNGRSPRFFERWPEKENAGYRFDGFAV